MTLQPRSDERAPGLAVVRWRGFDAVAVSSYPRPRPLAEAVARAFAASSPRESFWVEEIPWLASGAPGVGAPERARAAAPAARPPAVETARDPADAPPNDADRHETSSGTARDEAIRQVKRARKA